LGAACRLVWKLPSAKPAKRFHARDHHRRLEARHQGARQAPHLDAQIDQCGNKRSRHRRPHCRQRSGDRCRVARSARQDDKQREESEKIYADAGRAELAKQEAEEIAIIREYLPKQLSADDMDKAIAEAIKKSGAANIKDMGKVMAELKAKYAGQMDFAKASAAVKIKLG
jgi:uncharacterized protein YqeY